MTDHWVSPSGSDGGPGTLLQPYMTLNKANTVAVNGDRVIVEAGDYHESVTFLAGHVQWLGAKDANNKPLSHIIGDKIRARGFYATSGSFTTLTIDGFEISDVTTAGIDLRGSTQGVGLNHVIQNCHIHNVYGTGLNQWGIYLVYGNPHVLNCEIHHIGSANESWGVLTTRTHDAILDGNVVYAVRKEGIRGYIDKNSIRRNNRVFLCWMGLADAVSLSSLNYNNVIYDCTYGFVAKHSNSGSTTIPYPADSYNAWGYDPADTSIPWSRWYHNTLWRNTDGGLTFMNATTNTIGLVQIARQVDMRNNIVGGRGGEYLYDASPSGRIASSITIDHNLLAPTVPTPRYVYRKSFNFSDPTTTLDLAGIQALYGWLSNSVLSEPQLNDTGLTADYDYPDTSPAHNSGSATGVNGALPLGTQMGARGAAIPDTPVTWTERPLQVETSSTPTHGTGALYDGRQGSYWNTGIPDGSWAVGRTVSDLSESANFMFEDVFAHAQSVNPKNFLLDVSDSLGGPWTTVLALKHFDSGGASFKFDLPATTRGRYWRYTVVDNWGSGTLSAVAGFQIGTLASVSSTPPPPPTPTLAVTPTSLTFSGSQGGAAPPPQQIAISNPSGGTLTWTATVT